MTDAIGRAERLLAVPTAANVRAAAALIEPIAANTPPSSFRRLMALLDHALAIRAESYRLRCGGGSYAADGRWTEPSRQGGTAIEA